MRWEVTALLVVRIDMKMPKDCITCYLDYDCQYCSAVAMDDGTGDKCCRPHDCDIHKERETWCPLVEVVEGTLEEVHVPKEPWPKNFCVEGVREDGAS